LIDEKNQNNKIKRRLTAQEMKSLDELISLCAHDTISFWIKTRVKRLAASLCAEGNISLTLLKSLDSRLPEIIDKDLKR
jgi:hypothetical protein